MDKYTDIVKTIRVNDLLVKHLPSKNGDAKSYRYNNEELSMAVKTGDVYTHDCENFFLVIEMDSNVIFSLKLDNKINVIEG